jgi:hypothetical protein
MRHTGYAPLMQPGLDEMIDVAEWQAHRIISSQEALVASGIRSKPDAQMMRIAQVLDAIALLLRAIQLNEPAVRTVLKEAANKARAVVRGKL